jgi:hypothetical protein
MDSSEDDKREERKRAECKHEQDEKGFHVFVEDWFFDLTLTIPSRGFLARSLLRFHLLSLVLEHGENHNDEPLRCIAVFLVCPAHLPTDDDCLHLGREICAAFGEERMPEVVYRLVFASVKSAFVSFATSLLRKR